MNQLHRRKFLQGLGLGMAAPFVTGLPSLYGAGKQTETPKRLIIMFSPNGTVKKDFWPDNEGELKSFKPILEPMNPYRSRVSILDGVSNQVKGDGDSHMRGMSCLLTGTELFPGNIQGGSHTPAGWAKGISLDQDLKNKLQASDKTRTRFGSLEFGVAVPNQADPWTRWSYAGANKPVSPITDPRQMLDKIYGGTKDKESLVSILDNVKEDLKRVSKKLSSEDRRMLEEHMTMVAEMEKNLSQTNDDDVLNHPVPDVDPSIELVNDNTPEVSRMQIDLLVNGLANNMARVATLQYMRSVGQARMNWLGVKEGHHGLSHEPNGNKDAQAKLRKINNWFCGELAYLTKKLAETPEPGGIGGNMLDNTLIVWTNELGEGNSHTLDHIPLVLVGGENMGIKGGRSVRFKTVAHNRLLLALSKSMGFDIKTFGTKSLCEGGALQLG